ncbi:S8 family serine peptidase [Rhizobium leguminosarum bv. viciae]|uniref:S8 family peptidase n=1 Tax=Rhizobium ruizarguesonis TaxID=2081791 RepID=UPI00143F20C2|nr:S8 family peptidase [Rhizobium ruizarguesonis]NKJ71800.1 S8 family serine peptidase [Rhizobium leguminosarum bv. viciae]NKQ77755.1 hypothetical protein [Rhizobium ruizarguesonis]
MVQYKHLHIRGLGTTPASYRPLRGFGGERIEAVKDRAKHAKRLLAGLDEGKKAFFASLSAQSDLRVRENHRGAAVVIEGRQGLRLQAGSARPTSRTAKLIAMKRSGRHPGASGRDAALIFLTESNLGTLRKQIGKYGDWTSAATEFETEDGDEESDDAKGKPRGFWLFETASAIRPATLVDFWYGDPDDLPNMSTTSTWEVWFRTDFREYFERGLTTLEISPTGTPTKFIDTSVQTLQCTRAALEQLIEATACIVGIGLASSLSSDFFSFDPVQRVQVVNDLVDRLAKAGSSNPRIVIMDTGLNANHPLLKNAVVPGALYAADARWGVDDHDGHGTKMAGVAQYLDLTQHLSQKGEIGQWTRLESVKVQAPLGMAPMTAREAIERAVKLVETQPASRVFCLAQTARDDASDGRGTATSASLDALAYNDGGKPRLFCVAAGNVPWSAQKPYSVKYYEARNREWTMESPGQAMNVITIGAITQKVDGIDCVADHGDMAPTSRSAEGWVEDGAGKPDVVMEGGNFSKDPTGKKAMPSPKNMVLTTSKDYPAKPLTMTGETSAATAAAAGLLARAGYMYSELNAESLRGLFVHSAQWTPAMHAQHAAMVKAGYDPADARLKCLARYGWGVPNARRLYRSDDNDMTVVIEDSIQPFCQGSNGGKLNEMKYFKLPWPVRALRALGREKVQLKATLSYFIEPEAHAYWRDRPDRYASHKLRFDFKRVGESDITAQARINDTVPKAAHTDDAGWWLGVDRYRRPRHVRGCLHQDIWEGSALDLAGRDGISVGPMKGWWPEMPNAERMDKTVRFSLILSLKAPVGIELFSEVAAAAAKLNLLVQAPTTA